MGEVSRPERKSIRTFHQVLSAVLPIVGALTVFAPWESIAAEGPRAVDMDSFLIILPLLGTGGLIFVLGALPLYAKREETKVALGIIGALAGSWLIWNFVFAYSSYAIDTIYIVQQTRSSLIFLGAVTLLASTAVAVTARRKGTFAT